MKIDKILSFGIAIMLSACSAYETPQEQQAPGTLVFSTAVEDFEGASRTRTNLDGNAFEDGDKIKLKIICPYSAHTEFGETTYGNSFDAFWLLKWDANKWSTLTANDGFDINGDYSPSASPDIYARYLAQQTPYVFTAQTWSEEQMFIAGTDTRVEQYSNVFHANQSKAAHYKASDLMWAQTIMQTGSYNVHLSFKHVMAALLITIDDSLGISDHAVLTLEGMPDIDQREVIVGDCYAAKSKVNSNSYGYQAKHACEADDNGKVIGVAVVDDSQNKAYTKALSDISQNGTYTAYNAGNKTYRLIVPPCALSNKPTFWLRDGAKRYSMQLNQTTFEAGKQYHITMKLYNDETL
jgi:hypothetical protein